MVRDLLEHGHHVLNVDRVPSAESDSPETPAPFLPAELTDSQTMNESSARAALYIGAVSSTLVALGFLGQLSPGGDTFNTFALTVLPTLYLLGVVTFFGMVECGAEDFRYGLAINRIRGYYKQLAGDQANLFLLSGHDDGLGVFANAAVPAEGVPSTSPSGAWWP